MVYENESGGSRGRRESSDLLNSYYVQKHGEAYNTYVHTISLQHCNHPTIKTWASELQWLSAASTATQLETGRSGVPSQVGLSLEPDLVMASQVSVSMGTRQVHRVSR